MASVGTPADVASERLTETVRFAAFTHHTSPFG